MPIELINVLSSPDQYVCVYRDGEIYIEPISISASEQPYASGLNTAASHAASA